MARFRFFGRRSEETRDESVSSTRSAPTAHTAADITAGEPQPLDVEDEEFSEEPESLSPESESPSIAPDADSDIPVEDADVPEEILPVAPADPIERAFEAWSATLREDAGASPLLDISELRGGILDLTKAHPGGIAQLYAGRPTRLSSLVREKSALSEARTAARTVLSRTEELTQRYSSAPIYVVIGLARWTHTDDITGDVRLALAPILMRPAHLQAIEDESDFEIQIEGGIDVNPIVVRALERAGNTQSLAEIAALSLTEHGFSPSTTISHIDSIGEQYLPDWEALDKLYVGPFVQPEQLFLNDLTAVRPLLDDNPIVRALAGDIEVKRDLSAPLGSTNPRDREPDAERGVGDLDPAQHGAVEQVVTGRSLILDAKPGSNAPDVVAAILADAAASGRRVVYMPGTRRAGRAILTALGNAGLDDLILDLQDSSWRSRVAARLRDGMAPWEDHLDDEAVRRSRATLRSVRGRLIDYTKALHRVHEPWMISAYDSLQHLAELTTRSGPATAVRLSAETVSLLDESTRQDAEEKISRFLILASGTETYTETSWYGAQIRTPGEAMDALERSQILAETVLPKVIADRERVAEDTGLIEAESLADWNEQLEMLAGIRTSLDVFQPIVFERSAADLVIATATPEWRAEHGVEMTGAVRRRLVKQARDMLRPGAAVANLHEALTQVQYLREIWKRHNPQGGWPRLPQALGEATRTARDATSRLDGLAQVFPTRDLEAMPIEELREFLLQLGRDSAALRVLPEINALELQLSHLGLADLIADLAQRGVSPENAGAELQLAWWASVLQLMLESDPVLAEHDGASLNALQGSFRDLDRAQVASLPGPVRRARDRRRGRVIAADKERARDLWRELSTSQYSFVNLRERYADLLTAARPIWVVPPLAVSQALPPIKDIDLLLIDGTQHLPTAQAVAAIARSEQVVIVGDTSRSGTGVIDDVAGTLPTVALPTDRMRREEHLASFLAGGGWEGVVDTIPAPPSPSNVRLHVVHGTGTPTIGTVSVEGIQAEITKVLQLIREHRRADHTIAVISLSRIATGRIREAVAEDTELSRLLLTPEKLVIVDVEEAAGLDRDAVILSVGFAKTPHGRVLHRFGPISAPEGLPLMIDVLDAVVHDLEIVSALSPDDIERDRLHHPGAELLAELLDYASDRPAEPGSSKARSQPDEGEPDRLLVDLADRLQRLGYTVLPRYGFEGGLRIPLAVGHPDRPGELFVAVLTDDARYVNEPSLRRRDRYWIEQLEEHGWVAHMAFSQAVFMDPQREARAIAAKVRTAMEASDPDGSAA